MTYKKTIGLVCVVALGLIGGTTLLGGTTQAQPSVEDVWFTVSSHDGVRDISPRCAPLTYLGDETTPDNFAILARASSGSGRLTVAKTVIDPHHVDHTMVTLAGVEYTKVMIQGYFRCKAFLAALPITDVNN